jgi:hypothetical protein
MLVKREVVSVNLLFYRETYADRLPTSLQVRKASDSTKAQLSQISVSQPLLKHSYSIFQSRYSALLLSRYLASSQTRDACLGHCIR